MNKTLTLTISLLLLLIFPSYCFSATYSWYFSYEAQGNAAGDDSTGDGSIGNPWKTLYKLQYEIKNTSTPSDTVNAYLDGGDTFPGDKPNICDSVLCTEWTSGDRDNVLRLYNGTINVTSYGTGRAIIDGGIDDFSAGDPRTATRGNEPAISIESDSSTFKNIELKGVQSIGIRFRGSDINDTEISGCKIHNVGYSSIQNLPGTGYAYYNNIIKNNECYDLVQLKRYGYTSGWPGGITLDGASSTGTYYGNEISGNKVYNVYGEGILISVGHGPVGTEETLVTNNLIGDTWHPGILLHYNCYEAGKVSCKWNKIMSTIPGRAIYGNSACSGIMVFDEQGDGYDNDTYGHFTILGNIIIGRYIGLHLYCDNKGYNDPLGYLGIFNNLLIANWNSNVWISDVADADDVSEFIFRNNASIYFDQTNQKHINVIGTLNYSNSTISNNFYWDEGAGDEGTVDSDWDTSFSTGDPLLPGEPSLDWDGLNALSDVDFDTNLYPLTGSGLIDGAAALSGVDLTLLTKGTDFNTLPDTETFEYTENDENGAGPEFGAIGWKLYASTVSPADEDTGVSILVDPTWVRPTGYTSVDVLFDKDTNPPTTKVVDDGDVETYDPGTLDYESDYYMRIDVNHAGGTETGDVYHFTTTVQQNPPTPAGPVIKYSSGGCPIKYSPNGCPIK